MSGWVLLQKLHGIVSGLALVACLHPMITLRPERKVSLHMRLSGQLAGVVMMMAVALAWIVYPQYRVEVRPWLLTHEPHLHQFWFELKEALGFFALAGAIGGAGLLTWANDEPSARRTARLAFGMAALASIVAMVIGLIVASTRDLGSV